MDPFIHPDAGCKNKCDLPDPTKTTSVRYECRNGGKCVDKKYQPTTETGQYCLCSIQYGGELFWFYFFIWCDLIGSRCERRRSCDDNKACLNGGKCVGNSVGDKTRSTCGKGLQKEICTLEDSPNYHCECKKGFSGHWCEKTNACHPMKVNSYLESSEADRIIFLEYMWWRRLYYSNSQWHRKPCLSLPWKYLWKVLQPNFIILFFYLKIVIYNIFFQ